MFCTWNVLILNGTGYCEALISQLEKYNIAVCRVTEARLTGCDRRRIEGATVLQSGGLQHHKGVAVIIRSPFDKLS